MLAYIELLDEVCTSDQAETILNGKLYRYTQWDMVMRQFKHVEVIEELGASLAYSPLFEQSFQLGAIQFYRRRSHAIV